MTTSALLKGIVLVRCDECNGLSREAFSVKIGNRFRRPKSLCAKCLDKAGLITWVPVLNLPATTGRPASEVLDESMIEPRPGGEDTDIELAPAPRVA